MHLMSNVGCWVARFGRRSFLLSTSAVVAFGAGMLADSSLTFAQESRSSDTTLPKVTVDAPYTDTDPASSCSGHGPEDRQADPACCCFRVHA
jgi:hypothetical protein